MPKKIVYFGYGSNLWLDQMKRRCPESKFVGVGVLAEWKWMINIRGYANIIPSPGDIVYGLLYELTPSDEHDLDIYEGNAYEKQTIPVDRVHDKDLRSMETFEALVYVDVDNKTESHPRKEYIYRMNMGIADALQEGVPSEYIDKYLRFCIPPLDNKALATNEN